MSLPYGQPRVSCLMVTQASRWQRGVPDGALSYLEQTFESRELVIVTADPCREMLDWALAVNEPVYVMAGSLKLGALRQAAKEMAAGEFVATWDDDDISDPRRLALQVRDLASLPLADACVLMRVEIVDRVNRRRFVSPRHTWEMTMVARRLSVPHYRDDLAEGEDSDVIGRMKQVVVIDRPDLFTHVVHDGSLVGKRLADEWYERSTGGDL